MRDSYDFSNSIKNPYANHLKEQVTIPMDEDTIAYFKQLSADKGIPYQSVITLFLRDCALKRRELDIHWS